MNSTNLPKMFSKSGSSKNWNVSSQIGLAVLLFTVVCFLPFGAVLMSNLTYGSGVSTKIGKKRCNYVMKVTLVTQPLDVLLRISNT